MTEVETKTQATKSPESRGCADFLLGPWSRPYPVGQSRWFGP